MRARTLLAKCLVVFACLLAGSGTALAQITIMPEVRGGVAVYDVNKPGMSMFDPGQLRNANVELLFTVPDLNAWTMIGELRPHLGGTVSLSGAESFVYGGLSWTFRVPVLPVFAEAGLGGALHNDSLRAGPPRFGCAALFEGQASVGVEVLPGTSLMATVQHVTDLGMCGKPDNGLTLAGFRMGVRF